MEFLGLLYLVGEEFCVGRILARVYPAHVDIVSVIWDIFVGASLCHMILRKRPNIQRK